MPDNLRHVLLQVISQLCNQVGFERITEASLQLLIEITERYLQNICLYIDKVSHLSDGIARPEDGLFAVKLLGQSPAALIKFLEDVGPYFTPPPASFCGPIHGKVCLNVPPEGHTELVSRPEYIPSHLPLNYCGSEQNGSLVDGLTQDIQSLESGVLIEHPITTCTAMPITTTTVSSSTMHPGHILPTWAKQVTYRPIRVSIDPVTGSLVEHAPLEKIPDFSYDDDLPTHSNNLPRGTRFDLGRTKSRSPTYLPSSTSLQGATDAEWAAALQATPSSQPSKRIVYTPSRFDPSSLPSYMSSARRSVAKAITTASIKRPSGTVISTAYKPRPPQTSRAPIPKAKSLSAASGKRRRGSLRRARKWAKKSSLAKKLPRLAQVSESHPVRSSPNVELLSPSAEKTPPLRTTEPNESHNHSSMHSQHTPLLPSPASDTTPPADSPLAALRMNKVEPTDLMDLNNEVEKFEPSVDNSLSPHHLSPPKTPTPGFGDQELMLGSEEADLKTTTLKPSLPPDEGFQSITSSVAASSHKRDRPRPGKRGRGRRVMAPRVSIVNSLFQNPLRQRAPQPRPQPSNKLTDASHSSQTSSKEPRSHETQSDGKDKTPLRSTTENNGKRRTAINTSLSRHDSRSFTSPMSRSKSRLDKSVPVASNEPEPNQKRDDSETSPASDTTEPMIDEVRARILQMPDSISAQHRQEPFKIEEQESTFRILPFKGHNFDTLRPSGSKAPESLPSSPSSLDSTLSSSSSSVSKEDYSFINERPSVKPEPGESFARTSEQQLPTVPVSTGGETKQPLLSSLSSSPSSSTLTSSTLSSTSTVKQQSTTKSPLRSSTLQSSPSSTYPPPLLPLTTTSFDASSREGRVTSSATSDSSSAILPPTLVPVSSFSLSIPKPKVSTSSALLPEQSSQPSSASSSLLRFKIRPENAETRERLASSLSPSSSSSSLSSSGSTPSHPDTSDRMLPVPPVFTTKSVVTSDYTFPTHTGSKSTSLANSPAAVVDQKSSTLKTPKIVIRLGTGSNSGVMSCAQSPFTRTTEKPVAESPVPVDTTPSTLPPPPLKLTISKDRLTYRGNDAADNDDDSNASSSSSISESLNSSGDEDSPEQLQPPSLQSSLPPPPLERLPGRPPIDVRPCPSITRRSMRQHVSEPPCKSATFTRDSDKSLETKRSDVPPLLPLFSPAVISSASAQHGPPPLTTMSSTVDRTQSSSTIEGSPASLSRKRMRPLIKHGNLSRKRRINSPTSSVDSHRRSSSAHTRVRVDAVFTDDEGTDDHIAAATAVKRPLAIDTNFPQTPSRGSGQVSKQSTPKSQKVSPLSVSTGTVSSDTKRIKGRPRTKHTSAQPVTSSYSPAIKSKSHFTAARSKSRARTRPASASTSTNSSPTPKGGPVGSHRPASQVVVASAGNSYYFNNSGEQIWLCPICLLEDDGNLMIGCDSCDDWYHTTCLGLSAEPEVPQWFCPRCVGSAPSCPTVYSSQTSPVSSHPVQTTPRISTSGPGRKSKGGSKGSTKHSKR